MAQGENLPTPYTRNVTRQYWVDAASGNDGVLETVARDSDSNPYQTINQAITSALVPTSGDLAINVRPTGTYQDTGTGATFQATAQLEKAGLTSTKRLIVRKDPAASTKPLVRMRGGTNTAQHDCFQVRDEWCIIDGFECDSSGRPGITTGAGADGNGVFISPTVADGGVEIWNLEIHDLMMANFSGNKAQGIFSEPSAAANPILVYNCKVWNIGATVEGEAENNLEHGCYLHNNVWLINCLWYDITNGFCIQLFDSGSVVEDIYIVHNTVALTTDIGLVTVDPRSSTPVEFRNSILYAAPSGQPNISNTQGGAPASNPEGRVIDHCINRVVAGSGQISNAGDFAISSHPNVDPQFSSVVGRNFRPLMGSPADGFVDNTFSPAFDINNDPRPVGSETAGAIQIEQWPPIGVPRGPRIARVAPAQRW